MPENDPRVQAGFWDQLADEEFFALELADPYLQRVVRPNPVARDLERVVDGIVVEPPGAISRSIVSEVEWVLAADAVYRHNGDAGPLGDDPDPTARFAAGQPIPLLGKKLDWAKDWLPSYDQYFTIALRPLEGWYDPKSETLEIGPMPEETWKQPSLLKYRTSYVPRLGHLLFEGARAIRSWLLAEQPLMYVPSTTEAGNSEVDVPDGFCADLDLDQKRTLGWLVKLERDRAARTFRICQPPQTATEDDLLQWKLFGAHDLHSAVQIGPNGPYFNVCTRQFALIDYWSKTRAPIVPVECGAAIDIMADANRHVTALALVQANPFRSVEHWVREAKRLLPISANIVRLTSVEDHHSVSWDNALLNTCFRRHGSTAVMRVHWQVETVVRTPAEMGVLTAADDVSLRDQVLRCNHHHHHHVAEAAPSPAQPTAMQAADQLQVSRETVMAQLAAEAHALQLNLAVAVRHLHALVATYPVVVVDLPAAGVTLTQPDNVFHIDGHAVLATLAVPNHVPVGPNRPVHALTQPVLIPAQTVADVRTDKPRAESLKWARRVAHLVREWTRKAQQLYKVEREWRVLDAVLNIARADVPPTCAACAQVVETAAVTPCAHVVCTDCAAAVINQKACSACRAHVHSVTRIALTPPPVPLSQHDLYGTKIRAVVAYVQRIIATDPAATLVVYSQFPHLTTLHMTALCARPSTTGTGRATGPACTCLRPTRSTSGRATFRVVFLHPVLDGSEVMARAAEMRAVATLMQRSDDKGEEGENRREMTVVRFVAAGTVEERLVEKRCREAAAMMDGGDVDAN
ncbi:hypothetical protein GGF32_006343 [Allomyces javanicus]|nr:hypothetical protein GGF32_006343 [Allomyces javanicus]